MTNLAAWVKKVLGIRDQIIDHNPSDSEKRLDLAVKQSNMNVERVKRLQAATEIRSWDDLFGITKER
jgi:hypothetical protein